MSWLKRLGRSPRVLRWAGEALAGYLRLIARTSAYVDGSRRDGSAGFHARVMAEDLAPYIAVTWHGEHFLNHIPRQPGEDFRVLVSRHGDGEINAVAARRLGLGLVRGSGGSAAKMKKRGGVEALRALLRALGEGASIAMTADVPKVAKRVGEGTVTLARLSGRPVVPFAVVSRRHIRLRSWDRAAIGLPFSRLVFLPADPVFVPRDADAAERERLRNVIEDRLNAVHEDAYLMAAGAWPPSLPAPAGRPNTSSRTLPVD